MTAPNLPAIRELLAGVEDAGGLPWRRVTNSDGTGAGVVDSSGSVIGYGTGIAVADLLAAAPSIVAQLVGVVEAQQKALDDLMYAANHKAADTQVGRWWAEVIRGPIIEHLGAEEAAELGQRVVSNHVQCEDCDRCRVIGQEDWCGDCEYWSCERGPDCKDATGKATK